MSTLGWQVTNVPQKLREEIHSHFKTVIAEWIGQPVTAAQPTHRLSSRHTRTVAPARAGHGHHMQHLPEHPLHTTCLGCCLFASASHSTVCSGGCWGGCRR